MKIDLHTHSHFSDGTAAPAEVVRYARKAGVELLSLTDHDSVSGLAEAACEAGILGLSFVPGIEINSSSTSSVHILGYGVDPENPALVGELEAIRKRRKDRIGRMILKLQALGLSIDWEDIVETTLGSMGRPHLADALRRKGYVRTQQEAFRKFLMRGRPAFEESVGPGVRESIEIIRSAGGLAVLAHPGFISHGFDLPKWVEWGLGGLEAYYPSHSSGYVGRLLKEAEPFGLLVTGGSDYHGPGTHRDALGVVDLPEPVQLGILKALSNGFRR